MANKITWTPIEEMDDENGNHTCYTALTHFRRIVWLTQFPDGWHVELSIGRAGQPYQGLQTEAICKTLTSAKRYAARYLL